MSIAYVDVEKDVVEALAEADPGAERVPIPSRTTAAGTTTTLKDWTLGRGTGNTKRFDGRLIKILQNTAVAFSTPVTITGAHTAAITTLTVSATTLILTGYILEINSSERVLVTAVPSGTTLTVTRGYEGTTAAAYTGTETVNFVLRGFVTGVDDAGFDATDTLTVSPAIPVTPPANMDYLMYPKGLTPERVKRAINRILRNTEAPHLWAPSLVTDSDMESNLIGYWPAVGSPVTREFITTPVLLGIRSVYVETDAISEGASSSTASPIPVYQGEQLLISVNIYVIAGDMVVLLRDATAGSDIKSSGAIDYPAWTEARFTATVPTDCESAHLRFLSSATAASSFCVSAPVIVQSDRQITYACPSWLVSETKVKGAVYLPAGQSAEASDSYVALGSEMVSALGLSFIRSDRDVTPLRVTMKNPYSYPIFLECLRSFAELSYDSETTPCDRQYLVDKTVANILIAKRDEGASFYAKRAAAQARHLRYGERKQAIEMTEVYV